jgi:hypothetical protein
MYGFVLRIISAAVISSQRMHQINVIGTVAMAIKLQAS